MVIQAVCIVVLGIVIYSKRRSIIQSCRSCKMKPSCNKLKCCVSQPRKIKVERKPSVNKTADTSVTPPSPVILDIEESLDAELTRPIKLPSTGFDPDNIVFHYKNTRSENPIPAARVQIASKDQQE